MRIPKWATELTKKVLLENNCSETLTITWRRHNSYSSSGVCYNDRAKGITVRAGKHAPRWEQKLVLLHEVAHWLRPNTESHTPEFWKLAFQLYKENKIPIRKAIGREKGYRKGAENGYRAVVGLKPKKVSHKRKEIRSLTILMRGHYLLGIRKDWKGKSWAVSQINGERWRGYKISDGLYARMLKSGEYKVV